jgi:hypothetical protein
MQGERRSLGSDTLGVAARVREEVANEDREARARREVEAKVRKRAGVGAEESEKVKAGRRAANAPAVDVSGLGAVNEPVFARCLVPGFSFGDTSG